MANKEVWGKSDQLFSMHPLNRFIRDNDAESHPILHGLWRASKNSSDDIRLEHHLNGNRDWSPLHVGDDTDKDQGAWDHLETESNLPTKLLGHRISDRTRALIHDPHIAADSAEDEGHDEIAKMLRHGELVHTYHGYDQSWHPDTSFVHNGHVHMLVRDATAKKRYHFVRPVGE